MHNIQKNQNFINQKEIESQDNHLTIFSKAKQNFQRISKQIHEIQTKHFTKCVSFAFLTCTTIFIITNVFIINVVQVKVKPIQDTLSQSLSSSVFLSIISQNDQKPIMQQSLAKNNYSLRVTELKNQQNLYQNFEQNQKSQISKNVDEKSRKKRNLSVWTQNCCPTSNICGIFFEDCCTLDTPGCYMYLFCHEYADDNNCNRVSAIIENSIGFN